MMKKRFVLTIELDDPNFTGFSEEETRREIAAQLAIATAQVLNSIQYNDRYSDFRGRNGQTIGNWSISGYEV